MLRNFINTVRRFKAFTLLNLIGLSVAFLAFMVVVMQIKVELTHDTSYSDAERIYTIQHKSRWEPGTWTAQVPFPLYLNMQTVIPQAEQVAMRSYSSSIFGGVRFKFVSQTGSSIPAFDQNTSQISRSFVDLFGMQIVDGAIGNDDDSPWVIIPESLAKRCFPNGSAVGQTLTMIGYDYSKPVDAVYRDFPSTSSFPNEIYTSLGYADSDNWGDYNYRTYVKLPASVAMQDVAGQISRYMVDNKLSEEARLMPIGDIYFSTDSSSIDADVSPGSGRDALLVFLFIAILIVLVAAINYLNFTTALVPTRIKGINTRKIYGASNFSIRLQIISESVFMCLTAFLIALGFLFCFETLDSVSFITTRVVVLEHIVPIAAITCVVACVIGILAGLYPAFYSTSVKTVYVLKGSFALSGKGRALRTVLVGIQYVFSIALIVIAIVMNLQYGVLSRSDMGFERENVLTMQLSNKLTKSRSAFISDIRSRPDVRDVTNTNFSAFFTDQNIAWSKQYKDSSIYFDVIDVHSSFPKFFGIEIIEGEGFQPSDDQKEQYAVAIFNEAAQKLYGIKAGDDVDGIRVVGIMRDFNYRPLTKSIAPMAFTNIGNYIEQSSTTYVQAINLYVRCQSSDYEGLISFIRNRGQAIDPDWDAKISFMDSRINELYQNEQRTINQINLSSVLAIVISLIGVFGLIHFDMQRRRKEIALRKINGATISTILMLFNRRFLWIVGICFLIAAPASWFAAYGWLSGFAFRTPIYWWIFALALFVVLLITVFTVTIQSWKAASENPVNSLKSE